MTPNDMRARLDRGERIRVTFSWRKRDGAHQRIGPVDLIADRGDSIIIETLQNRIRFEIERSVVADLKEETSHA